MSHHFNRRVSPLRRLLWIAVLFLLSALLSLLFGSTALSWRELAVPNSAARRIFLYVRVPRTLGGALAGCGMAVSGAVLQSVLQNPLAGPNIIGVNAGAGFAALLCLALFPYSSWTPMAAFVGALARTLLICAFARFTDGGRVSLVLAGTAVSGMVGAASGMLKTLFPDILPAYNSFSLGSLSGVTMAQVKTAAPYLAIGLTLSLLLAEDMNLLRLGEDAAASLGLNLKCFRAAMVATASVCAGAAVSVAGLLGFVGLLTPHTARLLLQNDSRLVIPGAALLGAASVLLCDLAGRTLFAPFEIPAGLILSLLGGVGFLLLLRKRRNPL